MNVIDAFVRHARATPQKAALHGVARSATYGELAEWAGKLASGLVQRGLRPGDVVAIKVEGILAVDFVAATLGIAWAGGTSVSFQGVPETSGDTTASLCDVRFVLDRKAMKEMLEADLPPVAVADRAPDDIWRIGFSSGTTGERKTMTFCHRNSIAKSELLSGVTEILGNCTFVHLGIALTLGVSYWLRELSRGTTVLVGFDGAEALDAIERFGVDLVVSSPGNTLRLLRVAETSRGGRMPPIETLMLSGASVTPQQQKIIRSKWCDNLWINYGATEVGLVALLGPELMDRHPDCAGRLAPWAEAQVNDAGLLRLRSPTMASGYLLRADAPEWDRHAFDDGWFQSRDRARITPEGLVFLAAREDDVFNMGGNKIDPVSVEQVIAEWPGVRESAVLALTADDGSEVLTAFVVAEGTLDKPGLRKFCRGRLDVWKVPQVFKELPELPRNEAGKVMRNQLAAQFRFRKKAQGT